MSRADDFLLTAEELRLKRRKRRRILVLVLALVAVIVVGALSGRPALAAIKGWQSRRHAHKSFEYVEQQRWQDARNEAVAAYHIRPTEPEAIRAVARFLSRTRQAEALEFWNQLEKISSLTVEDVRDQATVALAAGDISKAEATVTALLKMPQPTAADWLLDAQLTIQKGLAEDALAALDKALADPSATEPQQFQGALLERSVAAAALGGSERVAHAWSRLEKLSTGKSETALNALVLMAQQILVQPSNESAPFGRTVGDIQRVLESHPLAKASHKLLALDLQLHTDPAGKQAVFEKAVDDWKNGDAASLVALATWLNGKGEYQKTLDTITLEKALQNPDVFLQHLDALGALGKWEEIRQLLEAERFPLDQTKEHMYLARCYEQLGQKTASENSWKRAAEAAGGDAAKLVSLGEYAEKNGKIDIADTAYEAAIAQAPKARPAWNGKLRIVQATRETVKIHQVLAGMLNAWPNDAAIQNDEAYTRLLLLNSNNRNDETRMSNAEPSTNLQPAILNPQPSQPLTSGSEVQASPPPQSLNSSASQSSINEELITINQVAERLVAQNPRSLAHRTLLALARLRRGEFPKAVEVYSNIQVPRAVLSSSALAVHAAALFANGKTEEAKTEAKQVKRTELLPEEWALVEGMQ